MKIDWIQHGGEHPWASQVGTFLSQQGCQVQFFCTINASISEYRTDGHDVHSIADSAFFGPLPNSDDLENKYGPPSLRAIAENEVHLKLLFPTVPQKRLEVVQRSLMFWENRFLHNKPDAIVCRDVGSFATAPAYLVARAHNVPVLVLNLGPTNRHMSLCDRGPLLQWSQLLNNLSKPQGSLSQTETAEVHRVIQERLDQGTEPARIRPMPKVSQMILEYLWSLKEQRKAAKSNDPIRIAQFRLHRSNLSRRLRWRWFTKRRVQYQRPREGDQYAYLPLFFEDEWQNLAGPRFLSKNMDALIEEAASSLPSNYYLYIKEHPAVPGELSRRRLERLQKIPGVRLIDPHANGQQLVKKSAVVISLLGSSGWEAVLSNRPVVVLFDTWYSEIPGVQHCKDINRLQNAIWRALESKKLPYGDDARRFWYIHQVLKSAAKANVYNVEPPFFTGHGLENSKKIAEEIVKAISTSGAHHDS